MKGKDQMELMVGSFTNDAGQLTERKGIAALFALCQVRTSTHF
jgi:hypothetical protein